MAALWSRERSNCKSDQYGRPGRYIADAGRPHMTGTTEPDVGLHSLTTWYEMTIPFGVHFTHVGTAAPAGGPRG